MLDSLRHFATTFVGKLLGALLLVGMAGFGINNVIQNLGSNTVAKVGNQDITIREFQRAYQNQLNQVAQQSGQVPTNEQAVAMGLPVRVIQQLAADASLDGLADRWGIGVSQDKLAEIVAKDPNFGGALGTFDRQQFRRVLQQNGFSESEYLSLQTRSAERQQIVLGLFDGFPAPKVLEDITNRYQNDKRTLAYFTIDPLSVPTPADPTDQELADYLKAHQPEYRTKETRTAEILALTPEALAKNITVTPDEVSAEYERTKAQYVALEQRQVEQLVLPDDAAVKAFEDGQANGTGFDAIAEGLGLKDKVTDLGTLTKPAIIDTALADAAFSLDQGAFKIIPGVTGKRVVYVPKVIAGGQENLDAVRDKVTESLKVRKAQDKMADMLDQIETLRAAFKPLDEIATRFDLPVSSVALTADGAELSTVQGIPASADKQVADNVFKAEVGKLSPAVSISSRLTVFFDLKKVDPARDQTVEEVKDKLVTAIVNEKTDKEMADKAEALVKAIEGGQSIDDAATSINQTSRTSQPIGRQGGAGSIGREVASAAFNGGKGHTGYAKNQDGDYVVFTVTDVTPATDPISAQSKDFIDNGFRDNLYAQFLVGLEQDAGMHINQQVLQRVLALGGGN
ncbi:MAG TPA: SurA N-terminal domain-containing protein [Devosiaceae bacterium]